MMPSQDLTLVSLLPTLVSTLQHDFDMLGIANRLLESYYLIDANLVLQVRRTLVRFSFANDIRTDLWPSALERLCSSP
jgi:hypothetical protein